MLLPNVVILLSLPAPLLIAIDVGITFTVDSSLQTSHMWIFSQFEGFSVG